MEPHPIGKGGKCLLTCAFGIILALGTWNAQGQSIPLNPNLKALFGIDRNGRNRLNGEFLDVRFYGRVLTDDEIRVVSQRPGSAVSSDNLVWKGKPNLGNRCDEVTRADYAKGFTFVCWVRFNALGGRLFDNDIPGRNEGVLIDIYPKTLRAIVRGCGCQTHLQPLELHVPQCFVVTFDGETALWSNGVRFGRKLDAARVAAGELVSVTAPIRRWEDALPLGNGGAGALVWGGGRTLNLTLDRADYWHNVEMHYYGTPEYTWRGLIDAIARRDAASLSRTFLYKGSKLDATKLPGVRLVLTLGEGEAIRAFRLDRTTAAATVTVDTPKGSREILAWFDDGDEHLSLRVPDGVSVVGKVFRRNPAFGKLKGYSEATVSEEPARLTYRRTRRKGANNRFDRDFTAGVRFRAATDRPASAFWRKFNAESSVEIPDVAMQRLYNFTDYLYGAGARAGCAPLALQGLWTCDGNDLPPWHGDYHNDMNTEMTYWGAGPAGRIEALEAFADFLIERLPEFRSFCRTVFGGDGAVIMSTMGYAGQAIGGWTAYTIPPVHGIWAYDTMCDAYDYDPTPEKAAKYLAFGRELAAGLELSWKKADTGEHLTAVSCSPEWNDNRLSCFLQANSSYERAIFTSFYLRLARLAEAAGEKAEAVKWRGYVGTFGAPHVKDGVLQIAENLPITASHRHPSHLMQIFPLVNVPPEDGVDFVKSLDQYERLGTSQWVGFSFPWTGCFEARVRRGDAACRYLKDFCRAFTSGCGFNLNGEQLRCGLSKSTGRAFTLEANFGFVRGIQEMLIQYDPHAREVTIFPALPSRWNGRRVAFRNLRVPGGHRFSAERDASGKVTYTVRKGPGPLPKVRVCEGVL